MSSGKGGGVDYSQSPQQQQMMEMFMQALGPMFGYEFTEGTPAIPGTPGTGGGSYGDQETGGILHGGKPPGGPDSSGGYGGCGLGVRIE